MHTVPFAELRKTDLHVDAIYQSGRRGNAGDDPVAALLGVGNQGGFRYRGKIVDKLDVVVLTSSQSDPDWPDTLDRETGVFTYYGDNKKPGRALHETARKGNVLLRRLFEDAHGGEEGRRRVPPIFVFARAAAWRDMVFLGLAVPGASDLSLAEDLVAIWRSANNLRFQNYRARFTILDASPIKRGWIDSILNGRPDPTLAPATWQTWVKTGRRHPLLAPRSVEHRSRSEQVPQDPDGIAIVEVVRDHFRHRPHGFEHCAAAITRLMIPNITTLDVTRPSRDGGRDALGQFRVGSGPGAILVDFALEAKCYGADNAVGVREVSRLISRLRHRQFGVLVTTSWIDAQAYREIKEDQHPIVVIAAADIVSLFQQSGLRNAAAVSSWLSEEFP